MDVTNSSVLNLVQSHFDRLLSTGTAAFGPAPCAMWMASLDTRTGRYPENDRRPPEIPRRHYRAIDAPKGCSLYWDQPSLAAAHALSDLTGDPKYAEAADAYVAAFLDRCVARNGVFLWGNHYYWDAFQGETLAFVGEETPQPVDFDAEEGAYHETRPIPPAWELFWRVSPEAAAREIRAFTANSLVDAETGGFNRHADGKQGCAFLESGGILVESLAWLFAKTGDRALLEQADRIVEFSYRHRNPDTGLLENNPTRNRWDKITCTTEVGLWAGCLMRAARLAGGRDDWLAKVDTAVSAYLRFGFDQGAGQYWGRLRVADGTPVLGRPAETGDSALSIKHQPEDHSDIWRPLFPAHDYPMPFAESCIALHQATGAERYRLACERWVRQIDGSLPARNGRGGYAEHYGRCIHFLVGCARLAGMNGCLELARRVAREAVDTLADSGVLRTHPGEPRYDAVDGGGYLLHALLALETEQDPDMMGSGW